MNKEHFQNRATYHAQRVGLDPELFSRLVETESSWNPNAFNSKKGATGLTQVISSTAKNPGFGVKPITNRYDHEDSLRFGADYLSALNKYYKGDIDKALAAYNWGAGHVDKQGMDNLPLETKKYLAKINPNGLMKGQTINEPQTQLVAAPSQQPSSAEIERVELPNNQMGLGYLAQKESELNALRGKLDVAEADKEYYKSIMPKAGEELGLAGMQIAMPNMINTNAPVFDARKARQAGNRQVYLG